MRISDFNSYLTESADADTFTSKVPNADIDVSRSEKSVYSAKATVVWKADFDYRKNGINGVTVTVKSVELELTYENDETETIKPKTLEETVHDVCIPLYVYHIDYNHENGRCKVEFGMDSDSKS